MKNNSFFLLKWIEKTSYLILFIVTGFISTILMLFFDAFAVNYILQLEIPYKILFCICEIIAYLMLWFVLIMIVAFIRWIIKKLNNK